jgi:hypothetical protein
MKANTYIVVSINQEQRKQQQQRKQDIEKRYAKYKEFRESLCDLFDYMDFLYYADEIGVSVEALKRMAVYSSDESYKKYRMRARNLAHRREFYLQNGHSITKRIY